MISLYKHFRAGVYGSLANSHLDPLTIWSDDDPDTINKISPDAPHRNVDLAVLSSSKELEAKLVVLIPATVYGHGYGCASSSPTANRSDVLLSPFVKLSIQIPYMIRSAIKVRFPCTFWLAVLLKKRQNGKATYGADGKVIFTHIHLRDTIRAYIVLLVRLPSLTACMH